MASSKNKSAVTSNFIDHVDRRGSDRRTAQTSYKGKNKRKTRRRRQDKACAFHENILYYSGMAIGYGILLTLYILIALGNAS